MNSDQQTDFMHMLMKGLVVVLLIFTLYVSYSALYSAGNLLVIGDEHGFANEETVVDCDEGDKIACNGETLATLTILMTVMFMLSLSYSLKLGVGIVLICYYFNDKEGVHKDFLYLGICLCFPFTFMLEVIFALYIISNFIFSIKIKNLTKTHYLAFLLISAIFFYGFWISFGESSDVRKVVAYVSMGISFIICMCVD